MYTTDSRILSLRLPIWFVVRAARFDSSGRFRNSTFFDQWVTSMCPRYSWTRACIYIVHVVKTGIRNHFAKPRRSCFEFRVYSLKCVIMLCTFYLNELSRNITAYIQAIASVYTVHVTNHVSTNASCSTSGKLNFVDDRNVCKYQLVDDRNACSLQQSGFYRCCR